MSSRPGGISIDKVVRIWEDGMITDYHNEVILHKAKDLNSAYKWAVAHGFEPIEME